MFFVVAADPGSSTANAARVWSHLWQLRDAADVSIVLPTVVSSPCPLLADERADVACQATGLQVPQNSAWVPLQVNLATFLQAGGDIGLPRLERALCDCVDRGEAQHQRYDWDTRSQARDSELNRRLAVAIRGWGCIVKSRGDDPRSLTTLRRLEDLAAFITMTLTAHSQRLARRHGCCPALDAAGARLATSGPEMQSRWQRAVADNAIRHRNLVMMSPWDVFPADAPADLRYVDLLPVLRCANSLSFSRSVDVGHWTPGEFRGFYERVGAILSYGKTTGLVAKQV
jgi:hypothetical protein